MLSRVLRKRWWALLLVWIALVTVEFGAIDVISTNIVAAGKPVIGIAPDRDVLASGGGMLTVRLTALILGGIIEEEDLLDGQAEDASDGEGQGQGGVVTPGLQGVDRLAGDTQLLGEPGLSPAALGAQHLEIVPHRYRQAVHNVPTMKNTAHTITTHEALRRGRPTSSIKP